MADKIGEASWIALTRKHKLELTEDGPLRKALARLDKSGPDKPGPWGEALQDICQQIPKLVAALNKRKKELGDKPFGEIKGKLHDLLAEAEALQRAAAASATQDEAESPALLGTQMIPLLRELRRGEVHMPALICIAGKLTAVLISRRAIPITRRKLLSDAVQTPSGAKFVAAECLLENGALTFVVQAPAAGLAKRLRQALLDQTEQRLKVRVRGEEGVVDEEGSETDEGDGDGAPQPQVAGSSGATVSATPAPTREDYDKELVRLRDRIDAALRQRHPESNALRAVEAFAYGKAESGDMGAALRSLAKIEQLLDVKMNRSNALERWSIQRKKTVDMLKALAAEAVASGFPEARAVVIEAIAVTKQLTAEPTTDQQVTELMKWLQEDDVVADVDHFAEPIREPLLACLHDLRVTFTE